MNIVSRKEAKSKGLSRYFTGMACKRGHIAGRYVKTKNCVECTGEKKREWKADNWKKEQETRKKWTDRNAEKLRQQKRLRYQRCKDKILKQNKDWVDKNRDTVRQYKSAWSSENSERVKECSRQWVRQNRDKANANFALYRSRKNNATPPWADLGDMKKIYTNCPPGMEVDHVIPLRGNDVCGLHVSCNLQYLTPSQNRSKGNRMAAAMPGAEE